MANKRTPPKNENLRETAALPAFKRRLTGKQGSGVVPAAGHVIDLSEEADAFRSSVSSGDAPSTAMVAVGAAAPAPVSSGGRKRARKTPPVAAASSSDAAAAVPHDGPVPLAPYSAPLRVAGASTVAAENAERGLEERWFLGMGAKVVGVQHYNGVVSDRENVVLRRQPNNPYDRNAIQVLNVRNEQIGHLPREMAATLAPLMDERAASGELEELRFEGHIPRGSGNVFSIPVRLSVFAHDPSGRLAPKIRDMGERLRRTYCVASRGGVEVQSSPDPNGTPVSSLDDATWTAITGVRRPRGQKNQGHSIADIIERELESIFRTGPTYEEAAEAPSPAELRSQLYPHQRKALYWMLQQERGLTVEEALTEAEAGAASGSTQSLTKGSRAARAVTSSPQAFFWTKEKHADGGCVYKNVATNSAFRKPPRFPRGGILADDMGLGKTITALALMLSDRHVESDVKHMGKKSGRNLIICPLSVMLNWAEQVRLHAPVLRAHIYHGPDRERLPGNLAKYDVVITTYDTLRAEAKDQKGGLCDIQWHRVVIDEAHFIKNHRTATSQAVSDLISAKCRWCLTGTPIQNSIEDIYALARFLKLEPFDRLEWFNRTIVRPLKNSDPIGFERLQVLLRTWCLRRTKDMKILDASTGVARPLLMLPQKMLETIRVPLEPGDRILYDRLFNCASQRVKQLEERSELGQQFTQVLTLLMRLRQLCCSTALLPDVVLAELKRGGGDIARVLDAAETALGAAKVQELLKSLSDAQEDDCSICLLPGCDVVTRCGHVFHRACVEAAIKELGRGGIGACPLCRQEIKRSELLEKPEALEVSEESISTNGSMKNNTCVGSKVRAVVGFLIDSVVGKVDDYLGKPHKAIVFSQFTALLDLVQSELASRSLAFVRLDGSMSHDKRVSALQTFGSHGHVQIILCSLKAAGTGINLTSADHVVLIDPWWNPAVEDQAIDRAHRLGQRRPVRVMRYVAERTVEERILGVHEQKRSIMEGALSRKSRDELQKIRLQMVASLFEPF